MSDEITNEQREEIVRRAVAVRDALRRGEPMPATKRERDMAIIIGKLLRRFNPEELLRQQTIEYLRREGLLDPLRGDSYAGGLQELR